MTEYEASDLFFSHMSLSVAIFMGIISATSALVVATYIGGHLIPRKLARYICVLYACTSGFLILAFYRNSAVMIVVRDLLPHWHVAVTEPIWILPLALSLGIATGSLIAIGALYYFVNAQFLQARGSDQTSPGDDY